MKAAVYYQNGAPDVLRYEDVADPECPSSGIVIRVEAVSVEGGDTVNRFGGPLITHPHVVGYQAAGEVIAVGPKVTQFAVGQKVVTCNAFGSHAELRAVHERTAWLIPAGLDVKSAAAIPIPFGTADNCLFFYGGLEAGQTVLIQSGASAVGLAAIQMAKRAGARVIATASSDDRLEALAQFGVDREHCINYTKESTVAAVMRITENKGVNVALDGNGGASLQACVKSLGWKGRATFIGVSGREGCTIDVASMIAANRSLIGVSLASEMATPRCRAAIQKAIDDVERGELKVVLDKEFPLSEAAAAHAYIESRRAIGRVLLVP